MQREQTNQITVPYSLFAKKTTCHDQIHFFFLISSLNVTFVVEDCPLTAVEIDNLMFRAGCITTSEISVFIFYLAACNTEIPTQPYTEGVEWCAR